MTPLRTTRYPRPPSASPSPTVQAIAARIHERGYTYPSVAARAGVSEWTVRRVVRGRHSPSVELVERLAEAVGLRVTVSLLDDPVNSAV